MKIQKSRFAFVLCFFLIAAPVFGQEGFWICPGAEAAMYSLSLSRPAYGGGLSLGYGRGASIGIKAAYLLDAEGLSTLELGFLLRWYFLGRERYSGPFVQITGGPVFFAPDNDDVFIPAEFGSISAGLNVGWRFLLGSRWFVEPAVRGGYPFIVGAGLSAGMQF